MDLYTLSSQIIDGTACLLVEGCYLHDHIICQSQKPELSMQNEITSPNYLSKSMYE